MQVQSRIYNRTVQLLVSNTYISLSFVLLSFQDLLASYWSNKPHAQMFYIFSQSICNIKLSATARKGLVRILQPPSSWIYLNQ